MLCETLFICTSLRNSASRGGCDNSPKNVLVASISCTRSACTTSLHNSGVYRLPLRDSSVLVENLPFNVANTPGLVDFS